MYSDILALLSFRQYCYSYAIVFGAVTLQSSASKQNYGSWSGAYVRQVANALFVPALIPALN